MRLSSFLYRAARATNDIEAVSEAAEGHPTRLERRVKNKTVGRALGWVGFGRWFWKYSLKPESRA